MAVDVKICGLTRPEDAALAAAHGAWRLGVIFAGGPRLRTIAQAADIVAAGDGVPVIGVFGDQPIEAILATAAQARLGGVQLHGTSTAADAARLRRAGLEVWRLLRVPCTESSVVTAVEEADLVLLEPSAPAGEPAAGGRGVPIDLESARRTRAMLPAPVRVGLAGGLTPERLELAIRIVGPDVVDVSSGVECSPGIKDPDRLIRFLEIARDAHPAA